MSKLGVLVSGSQVELAVTETLRAWMPSYLAEVAAQHGKARGDLPPFRSFNTVSELNDWDQGQLPGALILSPGFLAPPVKNGTTYSATFSVGVFAIVSAKDLPTTMHLARLYCAAMRGALLQHPSLGGFASGTEWLDESYDDLGFDESRTVAAGMISLGVTHDNVLDVRLGLRTPPPDPDVDPGEWGRVESARVVTKGPE